MRRNLLPIALGGVVGAVVIGLVTLVLTHNSGRRIVPETIPTIPTTSSSTAPTAAPIVATHGRPRPVALVLGDSYAAGVGASTPSHGFVSLIGQQLGWDMVVESAPGGGYAKAGTNGKDLDQLYAAADVQQLHPDVVIVQSGLNDVSVDDAQTRAAAEALAERLHSDLPATPVVVVGEFWPFPQETPSSKARDATIGNVWADRTNVLYLSPLAGGWSDFHTTDDRHPDDAGHRSIADHIIGALRRADLLRTQA